MVPTGTGKTGKMGKNFPVGEKSGNFTKTGKVRKDHGILPKILKNQEKLYEKN